MNIKKDRVPIPYALISIFLVLAAIILAAGHYYDKKQAEAIKSSIHHELEAISNLKVDQIIRWRNERLQVANVIKESVFVRSLINDWFSNESDQKLKFQILKWMTIIRDARDYHGVFLLDAKGSLKLFVCDSHGTISERTYELRQDAMDKNQVVFTNIHRHEKVNAVEIDIIIPLMLNDKPLGWLIFAVDPYKTLYPVIQSFPTASETGEFLLVSKDDDHVLFLNELRHKKDAALSLRIPLSNENVPSVMAVKGKKGIVEGVDYRGMSVVASLSPIPDSPWFLVAKIDKEEAFAGTAERSDMNMFLSFLLIISTALGTGLVWRHQRAQFYKRQYAVEKKHSSLLHKYEHLTKYANDIIFIIEAESNNFIEANERAVETYGYSIDELTSMNVKDIRAPEAAKLLNGHYKEVIEYDGYMFETFHMRKNGDIFPVEVSSRALEIEGEKLFIAIVRDITERKKAEARLKNTIEELRRLEDIINKSPAVAFLCANAEGLPLEFISANISLFGYKASYFIMDNKPFTSLIYSEDISMFLKKTIEISDKKISDILLQHRIITAEDDIIWVESRVWPIFDAQGNITHYQGVLIDIAEQKKLHDQLIHAQKMEAVGQLAGGIAHDFNNILTAILGYGYMLRMKVEKDEKLKAYIDQIMSSSERAANLAQSLLTFSRKQIINLLPININNLIKDINKLLSRLITEDIELEIILFNEKLIVMADKTQLEQVIMNLVINARDAMPHGGSIIIETDTVHMDREYIKSHGYGEAMRYVLISITDTGQGMDEKTQNRIFEPFFTTKEVGKGTGLGLSTVYGIVKQHNGYINVYSEVGKGTTFKICLPLIEAEETVTLKEEPVVSLSGAETILIAEDEDAVRKLYKITLEAYGYEIIEAADGDEAIARFIENKDKIQLLILDVVMPKKNGKEVYDEIKTINPDIKALFTSGYTENVIHKKGILDYNLNFLRKPASPNELLKKIREILDKGGC